MNHSMHKPIALCANARIPLLAARGAAEGTPVEEGDGCELEAMMNCSIFAGSGADCGMPRSDLPLELTALIVEPVTHEALRDGCKAVVIMLSEAFRISG
jgi:hypothetical protein